MELIARSDKAGKLLAEVLSKGLQGNRPVTLIGFSLGARVIFKCLQSLAETEENAGIVERVVLLGAPVSFMDENWEMARKMVAGRFVNVFSNNVWTLGVAFRARRELGMDEDLPDVLLMGGGEGMGPIEATARALGNSLYDERNGEPIGQVLVICGRNKKLANKLCSIKWKIPVEVKGFVSKMEECMGACDCIITKAGPGTIAEAMIRGLPIILNDYIAGQEVGNVPYVVDNGCGRFCKSPKRIANIVAQWFGPKADELKMMSQNALKLARSDAVFKIVHDLHELVKQRSLLVPQYACTT